MWTARFAQPYSRVSPKRGLHPLRGNRKGFVRMKRRAVRIAWNVGKGVTNVSCCSEVLLSSTKRRWQVQQKIIYAANRSISVAMWWQIRNAAFRFLTLSFLNTQTQHKRKTTNWRSQLFQVTGFIIFPYKKAESADDRGVLVYVSCESEWMLWTSQRWNFALENPVAIRISTFWNRGRLTVWFSVVCFVLWTRHK